MDEDRPLRSLALSFAVVGGVAGGVAVLAMGLVESDTLLVNPGASALAGAIMGAVMGVVVRRIRSLRNPLTATGSVTAVVSFLATHCGALAGLAVGIALENGGATTFRSTLAGGVVGLLLSPAAVVTFRSALVESRARSGSVVARVDSGRSRLVVVVTVAFLGLVGALSIGLGGWSRRVDPAIQVAFAIAVPLACGLVALATHRGQARAQARIRELSEQRARCEEAETNDRESPAVTDLGIGDQRWASVRATQAYRGARDASVVLRGDLDEARFAVHRARKLSVRSFVAVAVACVVAVPAVVWRSTPRAALAALATDPPPKGLDADRVIPWISFIAPHAPVGEPISDEIVDSGETPADEVDDAPRASLPARASRPKSCPPRAVRSLGEARHVLGCPPPVVRIF